MFSVFNHPFLDCVGLTDGPLCCRNAAGDATVALTHAPELAAHFLWKENKIQMMERKEQ